MRLPVIQTCGECGHRNFNLCDNSEAHPPSGSYRIDADASPPTWCPLRTGPDTDRIAALEAVASAAEEAASWVLGTGEGGSFPQLGRALASLRPLLRRLRRLT